MRSNPLFLWAIELNSMIAQTNKQKNPTTTKKSLTILFILIVLFLSVVCRCVSTDHKMCSDVECSFALNIYNRNSAQCPPPNFQQHNYQIVRCYALNICLKYNDLLFYLLFVFFYDFVFFSPFSCHRFGCVYIAF